MIDSHVHHRPSSIIGICAVFDRPESQTIHRPIFYAHPSSQTAWVLSTILPFSPFWPIWTNQCTTFSSLRLLSRAPVPLPKNAAPGAVRGYRFAKASTCVGSAAAAPAAAPAAAAAAAAVLGRKIFFFFHFHRYFRHHPRPGHSTPAVSVPAPFVLGRSRCRSIRWPAKKRTANKKQSTKEKKVNISMSC